MGLMSTILRIFLVATVLKSAVGARHRNERAHRRLIDKRHQLAQNLGVIPTRAQIFPGEYGYDAVANLSAWRSSLYWRVQQAMALNNNQSPQGRDRYDLFDPIVDCPPGMPLTRLGDPFSYTKDGGKSLCSPGVWGKNASSPCVVYSFGSNKDFQFEQDVLKKSDCTVYTFDCTVDGQPLSDRHQYHKICLGSPHQARSFSNVMTYQQIVHKFGHKRIEVAKIDVENFEWDVLASLHEGDDIILPNQLSVEFHYDDLKLGTNFLIPADPGMVVGMHSERHPFSSLPLVKVRQTQSLADMALLFGHLANLGYGILYKELNPFTLSCYEYVFLRVEEGYRSAVEKTFT